ncbi:MAG: HEPN domain-containing protein [Ferroplasma sp.]
MEQYTELILKYKMLVRLGYYPITYSIRELIYKLSEIGPSLNEILVDETDILYIGRLTDAYNSSRYMPVEFDELEAKNTYKFLKEVLSKYANRI